MAEAQESSGGVVLRGDDGSLYFIRDEVLALCKTEGEYTEQLEKALEDGDEVSGFSMDLGGRGSIESLGVVSFGKPNLGRSSGFEAKALPGMDKQSTLMCPW